MNFSGNNYLCNETKAKRLDGKNDPKQVLFLGKKAGVKIKTIK
jgi:hypothetical protein